MTEKNYDEDLKRRVQKDFRLGLTINELVKKYDVSVYYIKKWTKSIYKDLDLEAHVRYRYRGIAVQTRVSLESALTDVMTEEEAASVSEKTWSKWDTLIKKYLYDFAMEIQQAH